MKTLFVVSLSAVYAFVAAAARADVESTFASIERMPREKRLAQSQTSVLLLRIGPDSFARLQSTRPSVTRGNTTA
jgi:hypothetical protein